jgi:hypothetical protein
MKKPVTIEGEPLDNNARQEWIDQALRNIHARMIALFNFDFDYFKNVKLLDRIEFQSQLAQRMQDDLKESGIASSSTQWKQIAQVLAQDQTAGVPEHFAFYNPQNDTLYVNEKMVINYPEKVVSVCAHELAEKLLSSYISPSSNSSMQSAMNLYREVKKNGTPQKLRQIIDVYVDTVFKTVFKEGCCEAIAVQVLLYMNYEAEAASLEMELQAGYPKCIGLLSRIENVNKSALTSKTVQPNWEAGEVQRIFEEVLKDAQIIKVISYYLGYPLAKTILEKQGLKGIRYALENTSPPLKAENFVNPRAYRFTLENDPA